MPKRKLLIIGITIAIATIAGLSIYHFMYLSTAPKLRLGYLPVLDETPTYISIEKQYWKREGLDVSLVEIHGGAEGVSFLIAGKVEMTGATPPDIINAVAAGAKLKIVTPMSKTGPETNTTHATIVLKDSEIYNVSDLKGKVIAVFHYGLIDDVAIRILLAKNGIDPNRDVNIIEIPIRDQVAALLSKSVDAIVTLEPFRSFALETEETKVLINHVLDVFGSVYLAYQVTTEEYYENHPEKIEQFRRGWASSIEWCYNHPNETRHIISQYTGVSLETLDKIPFMAWPKQVTEDCIESFTVVYVAMKELGLMTNDVNISDIFDVAG